MTTLLSVPALVLVLLAACITLLNWAWFALTMGSIYHGSGKLYPTIYLASAALATAAYLSCPVPANRWVFLVPLADFTNLALPMIVVASIPKALRRLMAGRAG